MSRSKLRRPWPSWWPSDGVRTLVSVAAVALAAGAWGARALDPYLCLAIIVAGLAALAIGMARQAAAEQLAAALCDSDGQARPALSLSLSRLAEKMRSVEHRTANSHPTTGLPTREHLCAEIAADTIQGGGPHLLCAIRFADFDRLADFNLPAANLALRTFARRLVAAAGSSHVVAQIDRDCFGLWFRTEGDLERATAEFRAILYVAGQEIAGGESVITPTLEAGVVSHPRDGAEPNQLLLRLTAALAPPRLSPSGELTVGDAASSNAAREQFMLEQDLVQAIAEDQLAMVFQPIVDLSRHRIVGAEALLRWDHPKLGLISPALFIPIVESRGMSERYGLWVLNTACREARRWRDEGLEGLKVAVNLSACQLLDPELRIKIERTLQRHDLDPRALELELTETAAMTDAARNLHLFGELRAMGVSLAIDDFGSGYSSLSYLKNLPFDKLKIDREFVAGVDVRRDSQAICRALIELGRGLDLLVLAEGVETASEVATLRDLGCNLFQGYHFSKPRSGEDFLSLVRDHGWRAGLRAAFPDQPLPVEGRLSA